MNNPKAQFQIDNGNGWQTIAEVDIIDGVAQAPNAWTMARALHKQIVYIWHIPEKITVAPSDSTPDEIVDVMLGGWKKPITLDGKQVFISTEEQTPRDTHFAGFAKALWNELLANTRTFHSDYEESQQTILARRAYDLVVHFLRHTTPVSGSTIKKYQGMTIEEIANAIPDMPELPKEQ